MSDKILLTGRTGFVGSHLVEQILAETDWDVLSLERLPVRGGSDLVQPTLARVHRIYQDLLSSIPGRVLRQLEGVRYVVHAGAEVSGARSIVDPRLVVEAGVLGTYHLLEAARALGSSLERFILISTGEAVGAAPSGISLDEAAPLRPSNPYAAAKAAAEALCASYHLSFGVPVVTVRSMDLFGPRQGTERFIPAVVKAVLQDEEVPCHVDSDHRPGGRNWLHVDRFLDALLLLIKTGKVGEVYHVVGPERNNAYIIKTIASVLGRDARICPTLPGPSHDMRYALRDTKLGLNFDDGFFETLAQTVRWYRENPRCLAS